MARLRRGHDRALKEKVIDSVLTDETSFFAALRPATCLRDRILRDIIARRRPNEPIRIWSAASSQGKFLVDIPPGFAKSQSSMKQPTRDPHRPIPATDLQVDEPKAFSLGSFSFNFSVGVAARVQGLMGAPAFALRRKRLDSKLDRFWADVAARSEALWIAAAEGRIDEGGRELRPALFDSAGRDRFAHWEQRKKLFSARVDEQGDRARLFNLAWTAWIEEQDFSQLEDEITQYNKYFPIEANLPTDPQSGQLVWLGRSWRGLVAPGAQAILERHPLK
jgi:hypothetical protein